MKYIDAEKLKAEIERLKKELTEYSAQEGLDYIESYINSIQQPSLPPNLDEAAEAHRRKVYIGDRDMCQLVRESFKAGAEYQYQKDRAEFAKLKAKEWQIGYDEGRKAGAEWMAGQGVTIDGQITKVGENCWCDLDDAKVDSALQVFNNEEEVIVQIRKK